MSQIERARSRMKQEQWDTYSVPSSKFPWSIDSLCIRSIIPGKVSPDSHQSEIIHDQMELSLGLL